MMLLPILVNFHKCFDFVLWGVDGFLLLLIGWFLLIFFSPLFKDRRIVDHFSLVNEVIFCFQDITFV